jgi:two-component system sensor histidine kinase DegS
VARELHDGAIQSLIGAEMHVDALRRRVAADSNGIGEELERVQQLLRDEVVNLRELMQQLKPLDLDSRELTGFIAELAERFRKETGNSIEFVTELDEIDLPPAVLSELAKIVQEALVNVRKHSKARNVLIQLGYDQGRYKIVVDDDGQGCGWAGRLSLQELQATRRGPIIIKERVQGIGGELLIDSTPGGGTRLEVSVPRRTSSADGTLFEPHPYSPR